MPAPQKKAKGKFKLSARDLRQSRKWNAEQDILALKQEIHTLRNYQAFLHTRSLNRADTGGDYYMRLVNEYFRLFSCGILIQQMKKVAPAATGNSDDVVTASKQEQFVHQNLVPDVITGRYRGLSFLVDQGRRWTASLYRTRWEMEKCFIVPQSTKDKQRKTPIVIHIDFNWSGYFCEETVRYLFPKLNPKCSVVTALYGTKLEGHTTALFTFNPDTRMMTEMTFSVNFVEAMMKQVQDLQVLSSLFSNFSLVDECIIGQEEAAQNDTTFANEAHKDVNLEAGVHGARYEPKMTESPWQMQMTSILN